jgi:hypothetical protein
MSKTPYKRCGSTLPIRWRRAGGDLAQPNGFHQRADRPLIRSERPLNCLPHSPDLACTQTYSCHRANIPPIIELGDGIKSP